MSRTRRNDMGYEVVRDDKCWRALMEKKDPWDKSYYHAKGMKKIRYREYQWELNHSDCCTMIFSFNEFLSVQIIRQRYIICPLCHHILSELVINDHKNDHISSIYLRIIQTIDTKSLKTILS